LRPHRGMTLTPAALPGCRSCPSKGQRRALPLRRGRGAGRGWMGFKGMGLVSAHAGARVGGGVPPRGESAGGCSSGGGCASMGCVPSGHPHPPQLTQHPLPGSPRLRGLCVHTVQAHTVPCVGCCCWWAELVCPLPGCPRLAADCTPAKSATGVTPHTRGDLGTYRCRMPKSQIITEVMPIHYKNSIDAKGPASCSFPSLLPM